MGVLPKTWTCITCNLFCAIWAAMIIQSSLVIGPPPCGEGILVDTSYHPPVSLTPHNSGAGAGEREGTTGAVIAFLVSDYKNTYIDENTGYKSPASEYVNGCVEHNKTCFPRRRKVNLPPWEQQRSQEELYYALKTVMEERS